MNQVCFVKSVCIKTIGFENFRFEYWRIGKSRPNKFFGVKIIKLKFFIGWF